MGHAAARREGRAACQLHEPLARPQRRDERDPRIVAADAQRGHEGVQQHARRLRLRAGREVRRIQIRRQDRRIRPGGAGGRWRRRGGGQGGSVQVARQIPLGDHRRRGDGRVGAAQEAPRTQGNTAAGSGPDVISEAAVIAVAAALYLFDCVVLLERGQALWSRNGLSFGSNNYQIRGKVVALLNPLTPFMPVPRTPPLFSRASNVKASKALRTVAPLWLLSFFQLLIVFIALPFCLYRAPGWPFLVSLLLAYLN